MKYSINYNLNKPDYVDQYDLRHWNENTDIIDNQMKSEETSRIQSDTTLQGNINNEVNARTNADTQIRNDISDGTIVAKKAQQDGDGSIIKDTYQKKSNKVTSWSSSVSNNNYPSEKLVKDSLDGKSNTGHGHAISDVTNLQSSLDGKSNTGHGHAISDVSGLQGILDAFPIKAISYYYGFISNSLQLSAMSIGELKFVNIGMSGVAGIGIQLPSDGTYLVFTCVYSASNQVYMSNTRKYYNGTTDSGTSITGTVPGGKYIAQSSSANERNITSFILRIS